MFKKSVSAFVIIENFPKYLNNPLSITSPSNAKSDCSRLLLSIQNSSTLWGITNPCASPRLQEVSIILDIVSTAKNYRLRFASIAMLSAAINPAIGALTRSLCDPNLLMTQRISLYKLFNRTKKSPNFALSTVTFNLSLMNLFIEWPTYRFFMSLTGEAIIVICFSRVAIPNPNLKLLMASRITFSKQP